MVELEALEKPLVVFHANCPDGWTSAWICKKKYPDAELFPGYYNAEPPDVTDRDVLIVDFSYKRPILEDMHAKARSLRVFDHHATAKDDLEGLDYCVFDMERSGAGITWDELFGYESRIRLVHYVEDRDLWRFALPNSRAVSDYIMALPQTLEAWDELEKTRIDDVIIAGKAIQMKISSYCQSIMEGNARHDVFEGRPIVLVSAGQIMISDLLHHVIVNMKPESGIAMGWWQRKDGLYQYSLRSEGDINVGKIATRYGGGGHPKAAGFTSKVPADELLVLASLKKA